MKKLFLGITFVFLLVIILARPVSAHRSGCHRWHSCPSDSGSYTCGDTGHSNYCGTSPTPQVTTPSLAPTPSPTPVMTDTSTSSSQDYTSSSSNPVSSADESSNSGWWWLVVPAGLWGLSAASDSIKNSNKSANYKGSSPVPATKTFGSGQCPLCGGALILKSGKSGLFYGCSNFRTSSCRYTKSYKKS